jgi:site-specific DNA-methyltransferase (adenine-specific)
MKTPTLFETQDEAVLARVSRDRLHPHPDNPRLEFDREVVDNIATQLKSQGRFPEEHALLVRPLPDGDGYQIVSGHHRWQAATAAGLESVPVWVREMSDDEAFLKLVTENDQSELSRLERGMHALGATNRYDRNGQSLKSYAERVGVERRSLVQWRNAAEVESATRVALSDESVRALNEISKAPERFWEPLAEALVEKEWSVRETREKRKAVKAFDIPDRWAGVFLNPEGVVAEYLRSAEGFSPQTISRLADQADKTVSLIKAHDVDTTKWVSRYEEWLAANAGPNGRSERPYRQDAWRLRGLKNKRKKLQARLGQAEQERRWTWRQGDWREHIDHLEDGSVKLLLTDPPYGVDYDNNRGFHDHDPLTGDTHVAAEELRAAVQALLPKLSEDAHVLVFTRWDVEQATIDALPDGLTLKGSLIWDKDEHGTGDLEGAFSPSHERIIHAVRGSPSLTCRERDVIQVDRVQSDKHPTVKPQSLLETLLQATTVKNELVADPFGGIASTVVAATQSDRRVWSAEIDEEYYVIGKTRIENETA